MSLAKNELKSLVRSHVPARISGFEGISCNEMAEKVERSPKHITQVLRRLTEDGEIICSKEKRGFDRKVSIYYKEDEENQNSYSEPHKLTCSKCQRFSGLNRCILFELVKDQAPWITNDDFARRMNAIDLSDVGACDFFDPRVNGHYRSKTMNAFIAKFADKETYVFRCPIERCKKIIDEFSFPYRKINLGSNTFYCPHCGSPINFKYFEGYDRYQVQYWDSRFDILQRDFNKITDLTLSSRYIAERRHGISIIKQGSFFLDLERKAIYLGNDLSPEELMQSKDITYFSLRQLNYIAVKHEEDYQYLKKKLHAIDPKTGKELFSNITIYPPINPIESIEPTLKEIGGNEIIIATGPTFIPTFQANILMRRTVLEKKIAEFVDSDLKSDFKNAERSIIRDMKKIQNLRSLDHKQWQRLEGGFGSLMLKPFKKEAQKFGFETPSRVKSRMVKGESFLPFGNFHARSPYDSLKNGVNKNIDTIVKTDIYNEIPFSWNDLRGWCHRNYPYGLFLDEREQLHACALLIIHEAIRNEEIKPNDFVVHRGKRYEKYFCLDAESGVLSTIRKIGLQILQTKVCLSNGQTMTMKQAYHRNTLLLKKLTNNIADSTIDLLLEIKPSAGYAKALWKKFEETNNKEFLTGKELAILTKFIRRYFSKEFKFEPLEIVEIC